MPKVTTGTTKSKSLSLIDSALLLLKAHMDSPENELWDLVQKICAMILESLYDFSRMLVLQ